MNIEETLNEMKEVIKNKAECIKQFNELQKEYDKKSKELIKNYHEIWEKYFPQEIISCLNECEYVFRSSYDNVEIVWDYRYNGGSRPVIAIYEDTKSGRERFAILTRATTDKEINVDTFRTLNNYEFVESETKNYAILKRAIDNIPMAMERFYSTMIGSLCHYVEENKKNIDAAKSLLFEEVEE